MPSTIRDMPTAAFTTLGCKVNQYETQKILESFEQAGFEIVPFDAPADAYVINTCSVTSDAERKSRYMIRKARRASPDSKIVVTGCAAQMASNQGELIEEADVSVPNPEKLASLQYLLRTFPDLKPFDSTEEVKPAILNRTRAALKIQDGCSVMCSYCSIPYTRPGMVSRPWRDVLTEAQTLASQGVHEAILTGVLIGAYGPESGSDGLTFEELVTLLTNESGLARIRISSIEMHQVTQRIIDLVHDGKVVPHFHIPLQSGDSGVLKDMNRRYDQAMYLELCARLRREIPDITLTTDIMVGFPTETPERFESSVHVCEEVGYHSAHVFTFSPRWGTPADKWGDPITPEEKTARRLKLSQITKASGETHHRRFIGRTMRVLFESKPDSDGLLKGLTDNYLSVKSAAPLSMIRTLQWVRFDEYLEGSLRGEVVSRPPGTGLRMIQN